MAGPGDSVVWNEFAAVRVSVDESGLTPRLRLEDLESGESTLLDPVELASFITTPDQLRLRWLDVGPYLVTTDSASAL
ncbi:MAG: hypothetical protein JWO46_612 [Nocardioidaceae bacterium]|nr:hypothetical protein [Nocardioidaceae bacterium]